MSTTNNPLNTISRQTKFLELYKTSKDAAIAANETWPELPPKRRARLAEYTLTQPDVRRALDKYGLGLGKLMKKHQTLLSAKKLVNNNGFYEEQENSEVQAKMVELGYKMHGLLRNKEEAEVSTVNIQLDPAKLAEVTQRLEQITNKMLPSRPIEAVDATFKST